MSRVNRYRVVLYGASPDKPGLKAKVELYSIQGEAAETVGKIRFHEGPLPKEDEQAKGATVMNLPAAQLGAVLALLREEDTVYLAFHEGRAVLGTGVEPIGPRARTATRETLESATRPAAPSEDPGD